MYTLFALAGAVLGVFVGSLGGGVLVGASAGLVIGLLLARLTRLEQRTAQLEERVARLRSRVRAPAAVASAPIEEPFEASEGAPEEAAAPPAEETPAWLSRGERPTPAGDEPGYAPEFASDTVRPSLPDELVQRLKRWLTTGNVPVKVGVIVSFIGFSFLLKYAIDKELVVLPLELRLLGVALVGAALIAIGWRLRERMRVYALSLQGGGVGILFLTIFAALRIWQLLPPTLAFVMLVALTAFIGMLAVLQNAHSLALLGIVGGFLAPLLTSTGQGSHVVLFSYYLVLNGAILGIAWFRAWRGLNLVGFAFTFVLSGLWGYQYFRSELFSSTEPFLLLYFLLYQAIAVLYALRQPPGRLGVVDGTLVFGTPIIAFALQYELVRDMEYGLAVSAAGAAVFYALVASWLHRRKGDYLRLLTDSFIALGVAFATLAIPLALDARWTSAAWALEGAALVWIGVRQARHLANLAGAALIFSSGFAFMMAGWHEGVGLPVLNGNVLGGALVSLGALFASRRLEAFEGGSLGGIYRYGAIALFAWGALYWAGTAWMEIADRVAWHNQNAAFLLFLTLSATGAAWLGRAHDWPRLRSVTMAFLPLYGLLALQALEVNGHLLRGLGWLAWPLATGVQAMVLKDMDARKAPVAGTWHFVTLLAVAVLLALEAHWWTGQHASNAWAGAASTTVAGILALLIWRLRNNPGWPMESHAATYFAASLLLVAGQVISLVFLAIYQPGEPWPLPYLPVLNPFDLAMLFAFLTSALSLRVARLQAETDQGPFLGQELGAFRAMLAVAFFVLTTAALVRGVHFYASVPWRMDELFGSVIVQTALSIYWGLLGFSGMIYGARNGRRVVWLTGTGFMGLVVVKLFLVDLGNTGTLARIISFIGIGALLLLVGYLAPVPPREGGKP